jgi:hypothetical protein
VRPALELAEVGCVRGCFNIPVAHAEWEGGNIVRRPNEAFMDQVRCWHALFRCSF